MKIFFDLEFIEDGKTIEFLSIGAVREDGLMYYAVNSDADVSKADDWVKTNVLRKLDELPIPKNPAQSGSDRYMNRNIARECVNYVKGKKQIKEELLQFFGDSPEFWAYYCSYDWVCLCQLWGKMIDLPKHFPYYCNDLKQLMEEHNIPRKKLFANKSEHEHNAMWDALEVRDMYLELNHLIGRRP